MKCQMSKKSETQTHPFDSICSYWKPHREKEKQREREGERETERGRKRERKNRQRERNIIRDSETEKSC